MHFMALPEALTFQQLFSVFDSCSAFPCCTSTMYMMLNELFDCDCKALLTACVKGTRIQSSESRIRFQGIKQLSFRFCGAFDTLILTSNGMRGTEVMLSELFDCEGCEVAYSLEWVYASHNL